MLSEMSEESKTAPTRVRQQRKEQTRHELLAAARRVIERRGLAATTTREIAAEAGVAAGTFFVHFADMNLLVETLLDERIGQALQLGMDTVPASADLVGQLVHVAGCLYQGYDDEPDLARQYLAATLFRSGPHGPAQQRIQQFQDWVTERITEGVGAEAIPDIDPTLAFTAYFGLYFAFLVAGLRGELERPQQLALLAASLHRLFRMEDGA